MLKNITMRHHPLFQLITTGILLIFCNISHAEKPSDAIRFFCVDRELRALNLDTLDHIEKFSKISCDSIQLTDKLIIILTDEDNAKVDDPMTGFEKLIAVDQKTAEILWELPIHSLFLSHIDNNRLFIADYEQKKLLNIDLATGKIQKTWPVAHPKKPFTVSDNHLINLCEKNQLCLTDLENNHIVWKKEIYDVFKPTPPDHDFYYPDHDFYYKVYTKTYDKPYIIGNSVYSCGAEQENADTRNFYHLDLKTGETIFSIPMPDYSCDTPIITNDNIILRTNRDIAAYNSQEKSNSPVWKIGNEKSKRVRETVLAKDSQTIFLSKGQALIAADVKTGEIKWKLPFNQHYYAALFLHEKRLYMATRSNVFVINQQGDFLKSSISNQDHLTDNRLKWQKIYEKPFIEHENYSHNNFLFPGSRFKQQLFVENKSHTNIALWDDKEMSWERLTRTGIDSTFLVDDVIKFQGNYYAGISKNCHIYRYNKNQKLWELFTKGLVLNEDNVSAESCSDEIEFHRTKSQLFLFNKNTIYSLDSSSQHWKAIVEREVNCFNNFSSNNNYFYINRCSLSNGFRTDSWTEKIPLAQLETASIDINDSFKKAEIISTHEHIYFYDERLITFDQSHGTDNIYSLKEIRNSSDYFNEEYEDTDCVEDEGCEDFEEILNPPVLKIDKLNNGAEIQMILPKLHHPQLRTTLNDITTCGSDTYINTTNGVFRINLAKLRFELVFEPPLNALNHQTKLRSYRNRLYYFTHDRKVYESNECHLKDPS